MVKIDKDLKNFFDPARTRKQSYVKIVSLLRALGATVDESKTTGSSVFIRLKHRSEDFDRVTSLHKPHPSKELKPYAVRGLRTFLEGLGYKP